MNPGQGTSPARYAGIAAQAVRDLNHAIFAGGGYREPADVDQTLTELTVLVERLPQALAQAAGWLVEAQRAGRVGHDAGTDAALTVRHVSALLAAAGDLAAQLAQFLDGARNDTSHLTGLDGPVSRDGGTR